MQISPFEVEEAPKPRCFLFAWPVPAASLSEMERGQEGSKEGRTEGRKMLVAKRCQACGALTWLVSRFWFCDVICVGSSRII